MSDSPLVAFKVGLKQVMDDNYPRLEALLARDETHDINVNHLTVRYERLRSQILTVVEESITRSYQNGFADGCKSTANRTLLEVTHFMCARLTVMAELIATQHDWRYGGRVLAELSETLQRMPFTNEEGALVHRTLEPVVKAYGQTLASNPPCLEHDWMKPLLDALEKVPSK